MKQDLPASKVCVPSTVPFNQAGHLHPGGEYKITVTI